MPALNNELLNSDLLIVEFEKDVVGQAPEALKRFRLRLKSVYFEGIEDTAQRSARFRSNYPRLKAILDLIFSEEAPDTALAQMKSLEVKDWDMRQAEAQFNALNPHYDYFDETPVSFSLFKRLAAASRVMIVLFEQNNTPNDLMAYDYAYKLMALFGPVDEFTDVETAFKEICLAAAKLMKASVSQKGKPYHDVLLVNTVLPVATSLTSEVRRGWQTLLKKHGEAVLKPFKSAVRIEELFHQIPSSLKDAKAMAMQCTYRRADEDKGFAKTCSAYGVSEATFNAALDYMALGWPKKTEDTLPDVRVQDDTSGYVWFKLPVDDKRALILGTITHCCQDIDGDSKQCVKDGVSLSNNGLYVLGRLKQGGHDELEIIGQSYVWRTCSGNVCFDSIECTFDSINGPMLKKMTTKLAHAMMTQNQDIKRVTVGLSGKTPKGLFEPISISETMRDGVFYGDANTQGIIAYAKTTDNVHEQALRDVLKDKPKAFYDCIHYLYQYAQDEALFVTQLRELLATTPSLARDLTVDRLMRLFVAGHWPNLDDLKPVDFGALQSMSREEQLCLNISTARLIWQADSSDKLLAVLPYVRESERLAAVKEKNSSGNTVLQETVSNPESLWMILDLYPESERLAAVKEKNSYGITMLQQAVSNPASLRMVLALYPESERPVAVNEKNMYGQTVLQQAIRNPASLRIILELYPESERLAAVKSSGQTVLELAASNPESLRMILDLYPASERLAAVKNKNMLGKTMLHMAARKPESLRMILDLYPESERLAAVKEKSRYGITALQEAASNPESLRMILDLYPESERLTAVKETNKDGITVLQQAASNPDSLRMILALLPIADVLVLSKNNSYITFSGAKFELLKSVLYEKLNTYGFDKANSSRVKVLLDESRTLDNFIHIMEEMQTLRPQVQSSVGFFKNSGREEASPESVTENIKPKR